MRRFCKHIGALMLALPEDAARGVLEGIKRQAAVGIQPVFGERGHAINNGILIEYVTTKRVTLLNYHKAQSSERRYLGSKLSVPMSLL